MTLCHLFETPTTSVSTIANLYDKTENSLNETVKNIQTWMKTQPHLPEVLCDKIIQNFLLFCKCDPKKAKQRIDSYFTLRSKIDLYENINPKCEEVAEVMKIAFWVPIPKTTKEMYRVCFFKMRNKELIHKLEPCNFFKVVLNVQEIRLLEDVMCGDIFIFDMDGVSFGYMKKVTPLFLAKLFTIYEKIFSIPLKGMIFINTPSYMDYLITILKTMLTSKLFKRVRTCPDASILNEMFSDDIIPKDYGGQEKSLEELQKMVEFKLNQYQDRFDKLDSLKVDESLRPENIEDDIFGKFGSFKNLSID